MRNATGFPLRVCFLTEKFSVDGAVGREPPGIPTEKKTPVSRGSKATSRPNSPWFKWLIFGKAGSAAGYATFRCTWQRTRRYLCYDLVADHSRTRAAKVSSEQAGQSGFSALAAYPPPILVNGLLFRRLALPVTPPLGLLLRYVAAHLVTFHPLQDCAAVIPLIGD